MAKDKKPKKGMFAKIEDRDDALKTIKDTSIVSLVVAGIQVAIVVFLDQSFVNPAPFYAIFGSDSNDMEIQNRSGIVVVVLWARSFSDDYEVGRHVGERREHYPPPYRTLDSGSRRGSYIKTSRNIRSG